MRRLALLVLLLGAALATAAAAGRAATRVSRSAMTSDPVAEAVVRAAEYWGQTPCGGQVSVIAGRTAESPPAGENVAGARSHVAAMWATWLTPEGPNLINEPLSSYTGCMVHVNQSVWPSWQADDSNFAAFCKEMVHEYGHFRGFPDIGAVRGTVEYESPDLAHVPVCESYRLRYGHIVYTAPPPRRAPRHHAHTPRRRPRRSS